MSVAELSTAEFKDFIDGRYELVDVLGVGGMGTVHKALQHPIQREVALKLLRSNKTGDEHKREVKRFFKEARAIASLHHPHVISLYDFGQCDGGDIYMVMELLPGKSLAKLMSEEGPMPLPRAAYLLDQVLDALQEAHTHDIVHRDLKPDNIQVGRRGEREDFVTVLDFGIARRTDVAGTAPTATTIEVCGTPAYMSPEQILGSSVDPRADIYAVGALLFEMVTGRLPFDSSRTIDVYMAHLKEEPPRLSEVIDGPIPAGLQELLDRALAKSVNDRIADAATFRRALCSIGGLSTERRPGSGVRYRPQECGLELVAVIEPARSPGVDDLIEQWAVDVAQQGGTVREQRPGHLVASFPAEASHDAAMRTALAMKRRTRAMRLSTLRPLYLRVGIHSKPAVAERLCDEAPRGGIVIGADCVQDSAERGNDKRFRLESAGEMRVRGMPRPVKLLQLISAR